VNPRARVQLSFRTELVRRGGFESSCGGCARGHAVALIVGEMTGLVGEGAVFFAGRWRAKVKDQLPPVDSGLPRDRSPSAHFHTAPEGKLISMERMVLSTH
jgi:hypothetical protein